MLIRTNYVSSASLPPNRDPPSYPSGHPPFFPFLPTFLPLFGLILPTMMCNVNLQKCMSFGKCCPIICRHTFFFFLILIGNSCFQNSSLFNIQLLILRNLFTTIEVYKENCLYPISISIDDLSRLNIMIWEENTIFLRLTISIFFSISLEKNELTKKEFARIYLLIRIFILRIRIFQL